MATLPEATLWLDQFEKRIQDEIEKAPLKPNTEEEEHLRRFSFDYLDRLRSFSDGTMHPKRVQRYMNLLLIAMVGQVMRRVKFPATWTIEHIYIFLMQQLESATRVDQTSDQGSQH